MQGDDPARTAGLDMVPEVAMEFDDPHEALWASTCDGMHERALRGPVTEADRTPEGARDRFRRRTQAALDHFQRCVDSSRGAFGNDIAAGKLREECIDAAEEFHGNMRVASGLPRSPLAPRDYTIDELD